MSLNFSIETIVQYLDFCLKDSFERTIDSGRIKKDAGIDVLRWKKEKRGGRSVENRDAGIPLAVAARKRVHPFEIAIDATTLSLANTRISVNRLAGLRVANDRTRAFRSEKRDVGGEREGRFKQ